MGELSVGEMEREWERCGESVAYFVDNYCEIYDATAREWIPFRLWREQYTTLGAMWTNLLVVILKARQLGLTWLVLSFGLWLMLFRPAAVLLLFSRRDDEAVYLLTQRLVRMYERLPGFLRAKRVMKQNDHEFILSNGSEARAFPTTAGDSYTASMVIVDEADLVPDLNRLMRAVKPTIDAGGRMVLLSRAEKGTPQSEFKRIYRGAKAGATDWHGIFLPWKVRPERDAVWYERQRVDIMYRTGSLDDLYEQYPATDVEALSARTLDKRLAPVWVDRCYVEMSELAPGAGQTPHGACGLFDESANGVPQGGYALPAIPGLGVYGLPELGLRYQIGVDPAEGNPTSDDSALEVVRADTGEEVACLAGKFEPATMAAHADRLGRWYNDAAVLVERNNHGHAVLLWLADNSRLARPGGPDKKDGWLDNSRGKTALYDNGANMMRDGEAVLHSFETMSQLGSIEGSTLRAPPGEADDRADAFMLALAHGLCGPVTLEGKILF